ncbi:MAG: hypothetical protein AMK73_04740 [Planctomycetes bacterium SM23_32]|nr:MAG: hypothetical protein AMK73_04740 [Planctomycetes bacterium SM23_32]
MAGPADGAFRRLPQPAAEGPEVKRLRQVSRDFASLFYSMLVRQMQKTVPEDEEDDNAVKQGVQDFMGMFLPEAVARRPDDALAGCIFGHLRTRYGELLDETA